MDGCKDHNPKGHLQLHDRLSKLINRAVWGVAVLLSACAPVGPDYQPPRPELPAAWSGASANSSLAADSALLETWWTCFNDPLLNTLIQRGSAANHDLRIAEARIRQARAQYRLSTAAAAPTVDASGTYTNSRRSENTGGSNAGTTQDLFQAGFDANWEIDLFGGARRGSEAAEARLAAATEDQRTVLVTLEAEIARNYLELRGSQQRLLAARKNLQAQEQTLELARGRHGSGFGTQLEVAQAETQRSLTRAQLPPLQNNAGEAIYRLALLLGLPPRDLEKELSPTDTLPTLPVTLPDTLPSDLLRRRPDIRRAERQLAAATADIGLATAELFPRFSLTGLLGLQSSNLGDLLSAGSRYWTVGPKVSWSLFDAGRVRATIGLKQAGREEAQAIYEKTVLMALGEVEAALLTLSGEAETFQSLSAAVSSGQQTVEFATGRYRAGVADFLEVLVGERALYLAQDQLLQSQQHLAEVQVALFKALGGGWRLDTESSQICDNSVPPEADRRPPIPAEERKP